MPRNDTSVGPVVATKAGSPAIQQSLRKADLTGALTANTYNLLIIALFAARLAQRPEVGRWLGLASFGAVVPLAYLAWAGRVAHRRGIYFVWLCLMVLFLFVELALDHVFRLDFRNDQRFVVPYVMLFFAATGGMIGVGAQAGRRWTLVTVFTWVVMAALAFVQRAVTGL